MSSNTVKDSKAYAADFAKILAVLANFSRSDDYEESMRILCVSFLSLLAALYQSLQVS